MNKTTDINYHYEINKVDLNKLDQFLANIIRKNKSKLFYESIALVEWVNGKSVYKLLATIDDELRLALKLYKDSGFISIEYITDKDYKGSGKAFMKLLLMLKDIIRSK